MREKRCNRFGRKKVACVVAAAGHYSLNERRGGEGGRGLSVIANQEGKASLFASSIKEKGAV